jgi:hypothetical protein
MLILVLIQFFFSIAAQIQSPLSELDNDFGISETNHLKLQPYIEPSTRRHTEERARLQKTIDPGNGEWGAGHPRYDLLQALHSLYRYRDKHFEDLDLWNEKFDGISDGQKDVRIYHLTEFPTMC